MTYDSVVLHLVQRFPELRDTVENLVEPGGPSPYLAFPYLVDLLKQALAEEDDHTLDRICEFLEAVAVSARKDGALESLLRIEFGKWLDWAPKESALAPHLGFETKRICGYVPGLSTQRLADRAEKKKGGTMRPLWDSMH